MEEDSIEDAASANSVERFSGNFAAGKSSAAAIGIGMGAGRQRRHNRGFAPFLSLSASMRAFRAAIFSRMVRTRTFVLQVMSKAALPV